MRLALTLLTLTALGCTSSAPLQSRLLDCELITDGELRQVPLYAPDDCYERCLGAASCDELEAALCRSNVALLVACDAECAFDCDDGSLVGVERVCDGRDDCEGREDERGCPTYTCDNGQVLVGDDHRCDGLYGCRDGSDEEGCAREERFECANGERVHPGARCDGWPACADESDEAGCAEPLWTCGG